MKKISLSILILGMVLATLVILNPPEIVIEKPAATAPHKPLLVPDKAFWVGGVDGGNFIVMKTMAHGGRVYLAEIYNDHTGDLEYSGRLNYLGSAEIEKSLSDPAFYLGWDGEALHLANGESMYTARDDDAMKDSSGR